MFLDVQVCAAGIVADLQDGFEGTLKKCRFLIGRNWIGGISAAIEEFLQHCVGFASSVVLDISRDPWADIINTA